MSPFVLSPSLSKMVPSDTEEDILSNLSKEEDSFESSSTKHSKTQEILPALKLAYKSGCIKNLAEPLNANKAIKKRSKGFNHKPGSIIGFLTSSYKGTTKTKI